MVCGCIFGCRSVIYHFWVTVTLTSELGFPNMVCGCILGWQNAMYQFFGHCDLYLIYRIIVSEAYPSFTCI